MTYATLTQQRQASSSRSSTSPADSSSSSSMGLRLLVMVLAACLACAHPTPAAVSGKMPAGWCNQQIPGCIECSREQLQAAPGAQHPGSSGPPAPVEIVRCTACAAPLYEYNKDNENCDCASGAGSAYRNGKLLDADMEPVDYDGWTVSDTFPPGDYNRPIGSGLSDQRSKKQSTEGSSTKGTNTKHAQVQFVSEDHWAAPYTAGDMMMQPAITITRAEPSSSSSGPDKVRWSRFIDQVDQLAGAAALSTAAPSLRRSLLQKKEKLRHFKGKAAAAAAAAAPAADRELSSYSYLSDENGVEIATVLHGPDSSTPKHNYSPYAAKTKRNKGGADTYNSAGEGDLLHKAENAYGSKHAGKGPKFYVVTKKGVKLVHGGTHLSPWVDDPTKAQHKKYDDATKKSGPHHPHTPRSHHKKPHNTTTDSTSHTQYPSGDNQGATEHTGKHSGSTGGWKYTHDKTKHPHPERKHSAPKPHHAPKKHPHGAPKPHPHSDRPERKHHHYKHHATGPDSPYDSSSGGGGYGDDDGWDSVEPAQLVCGACPTGTVSPGGLIGAAFCNACPTGYVPDHNTQTCKSEKQTPKYGNKEDSDKPGKYDTDNYELANENKHGSDAEAAEADGEEEVEEVEEVEVEESDADMDSQADNSSGSSNSGSSGAKKDSKKESKKDSSSSSSSSSGDSSPKQPTSSKAAQPSTMSGSQPVKQATGSVSDAESAVIDADDDDDDDDDEDDGSVEIEILEEEILGGGDGSSAAPAPDADSASAKAAPATGSQTGQKTSSGADSQQAPVQGRELDSSKKANSSSKAPATAAAAAQEREAAAGVSEVGEQEGEEQEEIVLIEYIEEDAESDAAAADTDAAAADADSEAKSDGEEEMVVLSQTAPVSGDSKHIAMPGASKAV